MSDGGFVRVSGYNLRDLEAAKEAGVLSVSDRLEVFYRMQWSSPSGVTAEHLSFVFGKDYLWAFVSLGNNQADQIWTGTGTITPITNRINSDQETDISTNVLITDIKAGDIYGRLRNPNAMIHMSVYCCPYEADIDVEPSLTDWGFWIGDRTTPKKIRPSSYIHGSNNKDW